VANCNVTTKNTITKVVKIPFQEASATAAGLVMDHFTHSIL
jgi:hypothetical protein